MKFREIHTRFFATPLMLFIHHLLFSQEFLNSPPRTRIFGELWGFHLNFGEIWSGLVLLGGLGPFRVPWRGALIWAMNSYAKLVFSGGPGLEKCDFWWNSPKNCDFTWNHVKLCFFWKRREIAENTRNPPPAGEARNSSNSCSLSKVLGPVGRRRRQGRGFHQIPPILGEFSGNGRILGYFT